MNKHLALLPLLCLMACQQKNISEVVTTEVKRGVFTEEITEQGVVQSVNSVMITTPRISYRYGNLKLAMLVEDGKNVKIGDTLMVFDPSEVKKAIVDAEQKLEIAHAEYEKLKATQESKIQDLEADLEISLIDHEISSINYENAQFESEITRKEIKLQLETANISLDRAREQIENQKKIDQQELIQKQLTISQIRKTLDDANEALKSLFVLSPLNGIAIVMENWMTGLKWQVGESLYPGFPVINLPDLSQMKANVNINEVDISKIQPDLPVKVVSDTYSDTLFTGKVTQIANLAKPKDRNARIKVFPITILIEGDETRLLPGLTVSCKIKVSELEDVLFVPVESVFEEYGNSYVYLSTSSGFKRRDVKVGQHNTDLVVIEEGLSEGDEIAMSDPFINQQENDR